MESSKYPGLENNPNGKKIKRAYKINDYLHAIGKFTKDNKAYLNSLSREIDGLTPDDKIKNLVDKALSDKAVSEEQHDELMAILEYKDNFGILGIHFGDSPNHDDLSLNLSEKPEEPKPDFVLDLDITEKKIEKKDGRVNQKVFDVMNGLAAKINVDNLPEFKELREEMSKITDYEKALDTFKTTFSIPPEERIKIMACFENQPNSKKKKVKSAIETKKPEASIGVLSGDIKVDHYDTPFGPITKEEFEAQEKIKQDLGNTRLAYIQSRNNYKTKRNEHAGKFKTIMASLGMMKTQDDFDQLSSPIMYEIKQKMEKAREEYINAKKLERERIISTPITSGEYVEFDPNHERDHGAVEGAIITWKLLEAAEKEAEFMGMQEQKIAEESRSEGLKVALNMVKKGLKIWNIVPSKQRLVAKSILFGAVTGATGGLAAGAVVAGSLALKGAAGMAGGIVTGKGADYLFNKSNKKSQSNRERGFIDEAVSYEEREKADLEKREKEKSTKKKQRVVKAMAMVGAGFGAGVTAGLVENVVTNSFNSNGALDSRARTSQVGVKNVESAPVPKVPDEIKVPAVDNPEAPAVAASGTGDNEFMGPKMPEDVNRENAENEFVGPKQPTETPAGGGDDFVGPKQPEESAPQGGDSDFVGPKLPENLSDTASIMDRVRPTTLESLNSGKAEAIPLNVELSPKGFLQDIIDLKQKLRVSPYEISDEMKKNLMDKTPMEIAKDYGMYKADGNLSGMSIKGGHLGVDANGRLIYELNGKSSTMYDYENGKVRTFDEIGGKMFSPKVVAEVTRPVSLNSVVGNNTGEAVDIDPVFENQGVTPGVEAGIKTYDPEHPEGLPSDGGPEPVVKQVEYETEMGEGNERVNVDDSQTPLPPEADLSPEESGLVDKKPWEYLFRDKVISHEGIFEGRKISVLNDSDIEFDGVENIEARKAFNLEFDKNINVKEVFGENHKMVPFEKGRIDISNGIPGKENEFGVFLHGKKIAEGVMTQNKGLNIKLVENDLTVTRNGFMGMRWAFPDTVYERALKTAKTFIDAKMYNFYSNKPL